MTKKMLTEEQMIAVASPGYGARAQNRASTAKTETTGGFMGGNPIITPRLFI